HLVCRKPFPSMTRGFLNDPDRFIKTYFARFPGLWYHADWAKVDADGYWFILGRSEDTINVSGKRVGADEVEGIILEHLQIADAAAIGVPHPSSSEELVCFVVVLNSSTVRLEALRQELSRSVTEKTGIHLLPDKIHFVDALPRTYTAKTMRNAIRQ